jgi:hypothetical protein
MSAIFDEDIHVAVGDVDQWDTPDHRRTHRTNWDDFADQKQHAWGWGDPRPRSKMDDE